MSHAPRQVVFFLEEESAQAMLEIVFARLGPPQGVEPRFVTFDGKQDLEQQLLGKLRGYLNPNARFVIIRDKDREDCLEVKGRLKKICRAARRPEAVVRIACHELEAFYLGDLQAVETGLNLRGVARLQHKAVYRNPDAVVSPSSHLAKITKQRYQKVAGSRAIAPHLELTNPRSRSFQHLIASIRLAFRQLS
ncbi:MAG: DUF4276 family protein [Bryobacteraceae bacterium]